MRIRTMGALVMVCLISTAALAEESYLCIAEQSVGFKFDESKKTWSSTIVKTQSKYIVKRSPDSKNKWDVFQFGDELLSAECEKDFNKSNNLFCDGIIYFEMNRNRLRFLSAMHLGYIDYDNTKDRWKEGQNEPNMEIGKCSKI